MKNERNIIRKILLMAAVLLICMIPATVNAAEYVNSSMKEVSNNGTYIITGDGCENDNCIAFVMGKIIAYENNGWQVKSQKVAFSDKSILKMYLPSPRGNCVFLGYKKPGTTKVTVTTIMKKGKASKTLTYKFTVITQKFVSPVSSIKIDGKEYVSKIRKCGNGIVKAGGKKKVKFTYSLKKGWKFEDSTYFTVEYFASGNYKYKKIKNGGTIDLTLYDAKKNGVFIYAPRIINPKTGLYEKVGFTIRP